MKINEAVKHITEVFKENVRYNKENTTHHVFLIPEKKDAMGFLYLLHTQIHMDHQITSGAPYYNVAYDTDAIDGTVWHNGTAVASFMLFY